MLYKLKNTEGKTTFVPVMPTTMTAQGFLEKKMALAIHIRPEGFSIPEKQSETIHGLLVTRVPDSYLWTLNHHFTVKAATDLDPAEKLLRQSYHAVHGKS